MNQNNNISFRADGSPYSEHFNDFYFDTESGFLQSEHVFLLGNQIKQRLTDATDRFVIAETGFGTGLNFLITLLYYHTLQNTSELANLHFVSTEKYPLTKTQLQKSLNSLPQISEMAKLLLDVYPADNMQLIEGNTINMSFLDGKVSVELLIGDSTQSYKTYNTRKKPIVDAWYLDGFSPAKNPEMWQDALFDEIARLSKPQTTISTFTVAGHVRRNLTRVGFRVEKTSYEGSKEEILAGKFQQDPNTRKGYQLRPTIIKPQHVTMIGGGLASACAAYALTKKGIKVTLYCKDSKVGQGASSNHIGALYPLVHQQQDEISSFYQQAFWHALDFYNGLTKDGYHFDHDWCGLLEVSYKDALKKRQETFEGSPAWSKNYIHSVKKEQAQLIANMPLDHGGLYIPKAGWIAPQQLVTQLLKAAQDTGRCRIENWVEVKKITQVGDKNWQLTTNEKPIKAEVLVLCGGAELIPIDYVNTLPLTSVRGQISEVKPSSKSENLSTVICHKGYLTPQNKGRHCIGASFVKNNSCKEPTKEEDLYNLNMLEKCLPGLTNWQQSDIYGSKARSRCMTPDHLPVVGAMPNIDKHKEIYAHLSKDKNWRFKTPAPTLNNLYILSGLGARGLCSAPLLADILTADLSNTPYPVDTEQLFNLSANRFIIRDIIKRKFDN